MDINDFIISSLNLPSGRIRSIAAYRNGKLLIIPVQLIPLYPACDFCGGSVKIKEYRTVSVQHAPIAGNPSLIRWKRTRYVCKDCGKTFSEPNPFGIDGFHKSYALMDGIAKALHNVNATYTQIAKDYDVSPTLVAAYADSFVQVPRITLPVNLGIDEIHSNMARYGGSYLCVFVDNERRYVSEILPDRSKRTLCRYFDNIPAEERSHVRYVTIDMWKPYKDVAQKYLRNARIAVDPFHVVKHLTDSFESLRISIMKQADMRSPTYYLLKHWRLLLMSDINLDNKPQYNGYFRRKMNYRDLYDMMLAINPQLRIAYELKEQYRRFNQTCSWENAPEQIDFIIQSFEYADLPCYEEFICLLKEWKTEIINSFERPIANRRQSNALSESFNQKLRILISSSYGFSNFERFRARAIYCLNDSIFYALTSKLSFQNRRTGKKRGSYSKEKQLIKETEEFPEKD